MLSTMTTDDGPKQSVIEFLTPMHGKGKELCDMLRAALQVPSGVRSFSVHFDREDVVRVTCDYAPLMNSPDTGVANSVYVTGAMDSRAMEQMRADWAAKCKP